MEMDLPRDSSTKPTSDDSDSTIRQRSIVATQACESCRARKQKCDGKRPSCAGCEKLNKVCEYRELKPVKKDQTIVHILEALDSLESKINTIASSAQASSSRQSSRSNDIASKYPSREQQEQLTHFAASFAKSQKLFRTPMDDSRSLSLPGFSTIDAPPTSFNIRIESRMIMAWPAVRSLLHDDLASIPGWLGVDEGGEKWLERISADFGNPLPSEEPSFVFIGGGPPALWNSGTSYVTKNTVEELCRAYFRVYHPVFPILDRQHFYAVTLPQAYAKAFDHNDQASTKVLLLMALGAVAEEGESGTPIIEAGTGRVTGIRGGTPELPPGLAYLSEAKKRIGLTLDRSDLNTLHCFVLFAIYYAQCSRNMEYSHMSELGCTLCKRIVRTVDSWTTFESDLIARSYWMCMVLEGGLSTLGLSPTGLTDLESSVPLPIFLTYAYPKDAIPLEDLFIQYHFLAQITLRALLNRISNSLHTKRNPFPAQSRNVEDDPPKALISELARQLHAWRMHLPSALTWEDDDNSTFDVKMTIVSTPSQSMPGHSTFDSTATLSASLRTRYKYAQYLIWRPYIYKVLHFPNATSDIDLQGCAEAFKACSSWPLTFPAFQDQRRLIPHIFEYSHIFFGILVLMQVSRRSPALRSVLDSSSHDEDQALELSRQFFLSWMRDMQVVHPVARWCWRLLRVVYRGHDGVEGGGGSGNTDRHN